jgi:hypothetical protein
MKRPNAGYFLCCEIKEMQHRLRHNFYRKIAQYLVIIELTNSVNSFQLS